MNKKIKEFLTIDQLDEKITNCTLEEFFEGDNFSFENLLLLFAYFEDEIVDKVWTSKEFKEFFDFYILFTRLYSAKIKNLDWTENKKYILLNNNKIILSKLINISSLTDIFNLSLGIFGKIKNNNQPGSYDDNIYKINNYYAENIKNFLDTVEPDASYKTF